MTSCNAYDQTYKLHQPCLKDSPEIEGFLCYTLAQTMAKLHDKLSSNLVIRLISQKLKVLHTDIKTIKSVVEL